MSSRLMVAKKLSATALSQHSPFARPTARRRWPGPAWRSPAGVLAAPVGMEDDAPLAGRTAKAIFRASATSSVRMWSASAQPTTRRLARSMTVAR